MKSGYTGHNTKVYLYEINNYLVWKKNLAFAYNEVHFNAVVIVIYVMCVY